jgi:tetratricopeptide (TPR) repeat protein
MIERVSQKRRISAVIGGLLLVALISAPSCARARADKSDKSKQAKELTCRATATDKASEVVERCTVLINDNPKPDALAKDLQLRSLAYMRMGKFDLSLADVNREIELKPDDSDPLLVRAIVYQAMKKYDEARADCEQALRLGTDDAAAWSHLGDTEYAQRNFAKAAEDYTHAIEKKPAVSLGYSQRAWALERQGKCVEAIADDNLALQRSAENASAELNLSTCHVQRYEAAAAIEAANRVLSSTPDSAMALRYRGHGYLEQGKFSEALADFTRATELEPKNPEGWVLRGTTFRMRGQNDFALAEYDHALLLEPGDVSATLDKAAMALAGGDAAGAIALADAAIAKSPDYPAGYRVRGNAEFTLQQWDKAAADYAKAAKLWPERDYAALWQYLSVARGGGDGKPELLQELAAMPPGEWPIQVGLFFAGKERTSAVLDAATSADPFRDNQMKCEAYFYLGQAALLAGDKTAATAYFEKTIATGVTYFAEYRMADVELKRLTAAK